VCICNCACVRMRSFAHAYTCLCVCVCVCPCVRGLICSVGYRNLRSLVELHASTCGGWGCRVPGCINLQVGWPVQEMLTGTAEPDDDHQHLDEERHSPGQSQGGVQEHGEETLAKGGPQGLAKGGAQGLSKGGAQGLAKGGAQGLAEGRPQDLAKGVAHGQPGGDLESGACRRRRSERQPVRGPQGLEDADIKGQNKRQRFGGEAERPAQGPGDGGYEGRAKRRRVLGEAVRGPQGLPGGGSQGWAEGDDDQDMAEGVAEGQADCNTRVPARRPRSQISRKRRDIGRRPF
jgi:hypothetical protein